MSMFHRNPNKRTSVKPPGLIMCGKILQKKKKKKGINEVKSQL